MAARVILGTRGTDVGMWVSAPGKSATSTVYEDLLIDTTRINTQPLLKGLIENPILTFDNAQSLYPQLIPNQVQRYEGYITYVYQITHNLGFVPLCHLAISSSDGTFPYPLVKLTTTKIILFYKENWGVYNTSIGAFVVDRATTISFPCTFHYTLFRQALE